MYTSLDVHCLYDNDIGALSLNVLTVEVMTMIGASSDCMSAVYIFCYAGDLHVVGLSHYRCCSVLISHYLCFI